MQERVVTEFIANGQGPMQLLRMVGGWGITNGPGLFMLRSIISGTCTAAAVGVSASIVASALTGSAAIPFLVGSTVGFAIGTIRWYSSATKEALNHLAAHPSLFRLHLRMNYPWISDWQSRDLDWYTVERFSSTQSLKGMLVVAWLTAQPALDEMRRREEAEILAGAILEKRENAKEGTAIEE